MTETVTIKKLSPDNAGIIVGWCRDMGEDFLMQWAGRGYSYPLTEEQILRRLADGAQIFEAHIDGQMTATIELISTDEQTGSALIGRFVLDPTVTGKGLGTAVMLEFLRYCRERLDIREAALCVFDFNIGAYRCYRKCGFAETGREQRPNGWTAINMKKTL